MMLLHTKKMIASMVAVVFLFQVGIMAFLWDSNNITVDRIHGSRSLSVAKRSSVIFDDFGTCLNNLPYSKMHDERSDEVEQFQEFISHRLMGREMDAALPDIKVLPPGSSWAFWSKRKWSTCPSCDKDPYVHIVQSAWSPDGIDYIDKFGPGWAPHQEFLNDTGADLKTVVVEGDVAFFAAWFNTNYGHILVSVQSSWYSVLG